MLVRPSRQIWKRTHNGIVDTACGGERCYLINKNTPNIYQEQEKVTER